MGQVIKGAKESVNDHPGLFNSSIYFDQPVSFHDPEILYEVSSPSTPCPASYAKMRLG
jgi:hypothetical protein